jgi:hypothetical protein
MHGPWLSHGDLEDHGAVGLQEDRAEVVVADAQVRGGILVELDVEPLEALGASQKEMGGRAAGDPAGQRLWSRSFTQRPLPTATCWPGTLAWVVS